MPITKHYRTQAKPPALSPNALTFDKMVYFVESEKARALFYGAFRGTEGDFSARMGKISKTPNRGLPRRYRLQGITAPSVNLPA
jgi:hypothetical protein